MANNRFNKQVSPKGYAEVILKRSKTWCYKESIKNI